MILHTLILTSAAYPLQFEGVTECGKTICIHYRSERLSVAIDNKFSLIHKDTNPTYLGMELSRKEVQQKVEAYGIVFPKGLSLCEVGYD